MNSAYQLSPREREVYDLRQQGRGYKDIARTLNLSVKTVRSVYQTAKEKIKAQSEA